MLALMKGKLPELKVAKRNVKPKKGNNMANNVRAWILQLLSSLGLKRKLSNLFQAVAVVAMTIPGLQVFASSLQSIASWLGVAGIGHAAIDGTLGVDLHTVTAFFSALLLAAQTNPDLAVYLPLIKVVSFILGLFSSVQLIGNRQKL